MKNIKFEIFIEWLFKFIFVGLILLIQLFFLNDFLLI